MWQVFCKYLWRFTLQRNSGESLWCCQQSSQTFLQARKRGKLSWLFVVVFLQPHDFFCTLCCADTCPLLYITAIFESNNVASVFYWQIHTHPFNGPFSGTTQVSTVSGSGISWAICKSASRSRQITTPVPHHSVFLQAGCPSCRPTNSVNALKAQILAEILDTFLPYYQ